MLPRGIRQKDAITYLGVDKSFFLHEVKPKLHPKKMSKKVVIFDRLELDAWFDEHIHRHGASQEDLWDKSNSPMASYGERSRTGRSAKASTSINSTPVGDFADAAKRLRLKRRKGG